MSKTTSVPAIQVRSFRDGGFRRCGRRFGPAWSEPIARADLTAEEIAALESDPNLAVRDAAIESAAPKASDAGDETKQPDAGDETKQPDAKQPPAKGAGGKKTEAKS
ncbi:MAG: hypothetical protein NXI21_01785 [Alphaproteobacteria bacterium]|nr:hypothetical protein [Alphaproteobacteria bacterium]